VLHGLEAVLDRRDRCHFLAFHPRLG
jgi:hypothetical protein